VLITSDALEGCFSLGALQLEVSVPGVEYCRQHLVFFTHGASTAAVLGIPSFNRQPLVLITSDALVIFKGCFSLCLVLNTAGSFSLW
jgi:hypothetical protein